MRHDDSLRCLLQQNTGSSFNDQSSFKIVAPLNGNTTMCSIQSSDFPDHYVAPKSATQPNDVWITNVNMNDPVDKNRASWIRGTSLLQSQNQPAQGKIPACRMVDNKVSCVSWGGTTLAVWDDEKTCNEWADPVANPGSVTYPNVTYPGDVVANIVDKYLRTRV